MFFGVKFDQLGNTFGIIQIYCVEAKRQIMYGLNKEERAELEELKNFFNIEDKDEKVSLLMDNPKKGKRFEELLKKKLDLLWATLN